MEMIEMTKELSGEHVESAIDFETATSTKITTSQNQAMVKGMGVYTERADLETNVEPDSSDGRHQGNDRNPNGTSLSDLMCVILAKAEGFAMGVKRRCEMKVAEHTTQWLQEKTSGKGRDCELHKPREGPCPMEGMQRQDQEEEHTKKTH